MAGNLLSTASDLWPAISKALYIISGTWFLIAPDESSIPLQTKSYWYARMSNGFSFNNASIPPCGIEKGLWENSILPVFSSFSNIG